MTLSTGKHIDLGEIRQWEFYRGLLEGLPTVEMNRRRLAHILTEQREARGREPYLIKPVETPIAYEGTYPFGTPAALPPIVSVAWFTCHWPVRDENKDRSSLTVIWFQQDFGVLVDDEIQHALANIPWDIVAFDDDL